MQVGMDMKISDLLFANHITLIIVEKVHCIVYHLERLSTMGTHMENFHRSEISISYRDILEINVFY